jgi:hypothetical protein
MSAAAPQSYRCRGLRKWCDRRCEASTNLAPLGWPGAGFYCALHGYQKPRAAADGSLDVAPELEQHLRRRTSLVPPEAAVAAEIAKSPGLVRDRPGAPASATGQAVVGWLVERKRFSEQSAQAYGARMVALDVLRPVAGSGAPSVGFAPDKAALYTVVAALPARKG